MTEELLAVYRHSLAHVLAKAVIEIFGKENVQYAIGPQIADGLYYDLCFRARSPRMTTRSSRTRCMRLSRGRKTGPARS